MVWHPDMDVRCGVLYSAYVQRERLVVYKELANCVLYHEEERRADGERFCFASRSWLVVWDTDR